MPKDAELDRLKTTQDRAYQRKQDAWKAQDEAWKRRCAAREAMVRARDVKQHAYEIQQAAWEDLQHVRDRNGPRIDQLNSQQESSYQQMRSAFDRASSAHAARDGASAKRYADEGHSHKADSQRAVEERRQLVQAIRDARARHDSTKPAFQQAKVVLDQARSAFDQAKAHHEQKQVEFKAAQAEFERARNAFKARLEAVRANSQRSQDDKRSQARRAGVPDQYLDNLRIITKSDGTVHMYFGGIGEPTGPGHGHYVIHSSGEISYRRDPAKPHGTQNFTDRPQPSRGWDPVSSKPPHAGVLEGTDHIASFKTGGPSGDQTLIADGDYSDDRKGFNGPRGNRSHNHYGTKAEAKPDDTDKWVDKDRGKYTGPDR